MPETLYVVYDTTNNRAMGHYYNSQYEATEQLKLLKVVCPDYNYKLIVYRRCMVCDA